MSLFTQCVRCRIGGHLATEESQVRLPNGRSFAVQQPAEGEIHRTIGAGEGGERTVPCCDLFFKVISINLFMNFE